MIVKDKLLKLFQQNGLGFLQVRKSDRIDISDFASSDCLRLAKSMGKNPIELANEVKATLENMDCFHSVSVDGPGFLNLKMTREFWEQQINEITSEALLTKPLKAKKIVIDYGGPNIAKPLHAGHLRSAVIGESIKRILKTAGHNVIADIHLGDWGLQMGLVFVGFEMEKIDVNNITMQTLNYLYPKYSKLSKENEDILKKAQDYTLQLQQGNLEFRKLWQKCYDVSVVAIKSNYEKLGIEFDLFLGESDAHELSEQLAVELKNAGKLELSDGAWIIDVKTDMDKKEMPPVIVIKSNGSFGYQMTEIATLVARQRDFKPDEIIYITDFRQNLHFEEVFRAVKKVKLVSPELELVHIGFGTMNGKDGKPFKTRDGGILTLDDLIDLTKNAGYEKINKEKIVDENDRQKLALSIGVAALKFGDLINVITSDYVLDLDAFSSFEGKTGPYIQYSAVRIKSVLEKSGNVGGVIKFYNEYDLDLAKAIMEFDDAFCESVEKLAPHYVCLKAYEIAQKFNTFYHFCHITDEVDEQKKKSWVELSKKTLSVFERFSDLIGFEIVDKM